MFDKILHTEKKKNLKNPNILEKLCVSVVNSTQWLFNEETLTEKCLNSISSLNFIYIELDEEEVWIDLWRQNQSRIHVNRMLLVAFMFNFYISNSL